MNRRFYIFIGIGLIIVVGLLVVYLAAGRQSTPATQQLKPTMAIPVTNGAVTVSDPTLAPIEQVGDDSVIVRTDTYQISYFAEDKSFLISLLDQPIREVRAVAEQAFLNKLAITQEQACQLSVRVSVPYNVDPLSAGESYKLSFCK